MDDLGVPPSSLNSGERRQPSRFRSASQAPSEILERSIHSTHTTSVQDSPQDEKQSVNGQSPRPQRNLRDRKSTAVLDPVEEAMKPLTDKERRNWKGWVELESDPVSASSPLLPLDKNIRCESCSQRLTPYLRLFSATF
jgi:ubiquitin carboxyl-terminal hydrolase L5